MNRYLKALGITLLSGSAALVTGLAAMAQPSPTPEAVPAETTPAAPEDVNALSQELEQQPQTPEEFLVQVFDLTDDQRNAIVEIFNTYQPQIRQAAGAYFEALDYLSTVVVPSSSNQVIADARADVLEQERATYDLIFERNLAIRDVLNPTQRETINNAIRELFDLGTVADLPPIEFPMTLIGMPTADAVADLMADDWMVVVQTPTLVQLNRGSQQLDLDINRSGRIDAAVLR